MAEGTRAFITVQTVMGRSQKGHLGCAGMAHIKPPHSQFAIQLLRLSYRGIPKGSLTQGNFDEKNEHEDDLDAPVCAAVCIFAQFIPDLREMSVGERGLGR
jgi:predicted RNase H-like nuclease